VSNPFQVGRSGPTTRVFGPPYLPSSFFVHETTTVAHLFPGTLAVPTFRRCGRYEQISTFPQPLFREMSARSASHAVLLAKRGDEYRKIHRSRYLEKRE